MNDFDNAFQSQRLFLPYTVANLETRGILYSDDHVTCHVQKDHPAAILIACNPEYFGFDAKSFTASHRKWIKVPKCLLRSCCDIIISSQVS